MAIAARRAGLHGAVVPTSNAEEAALVEGLEVVGASSLAEVVGFFRGAWRPRAPEAVGAVEDVRHAVDLAEVRGQAQARRALEVAAAGGHNGSYGRLAGAGKTMLARRLATILPALSRAESLEVTQLHSVPGLLEGGLIRERPFRSPHHTVSPHLSRIIPTSTARSVRSSSQSISRPADDFGRRPAYRSRREQRARDDS